MRNYFDLVLCESEDGTRKLYYAPAFTHLQKNDAVIVDGKDGQVCVNVVSSITLSEDDTETIDFILNATGSSEVLEQITSKVVFKKLIYHEQEETGT